MSSIVRKLGLTSRVATSISLSTRHLTTTQPPPRPLEGFRVLECGQLIAGPFCGTLLGYFGAEVIKVEPPGVGDPIRVWRELDTDGTSPWWRSIGRNKKSIELSLKSDEGRQIVKQLAAECDVIIENFKPGTMERWGLGPSDLAEVNPELVFVRLSGYGQNGPLATKPGFASVCEAFGGFRHVNGFADRPPVRPNLSMGDTLAGLHAALGATLALLSRERRRGGGGGGGGGRSGGGVCEVVDVAIYEAVFNMLEGVVPEYDRKGVIRQPSGSTLTGIVPTNTYLCADGKYVVIGGNGDSIFKRLMVAATRPEMADDPRLASNPGRVEHQDEVDGAISAWTATLPSALVLAALDEANVPSGPIYAVDDMVGDAHFNARGMFEEVMVGGKPLKLPALCPRLEHGRGATQWAGPELGEHTRGVLEGLLKLSPEQVDKLAASGAIGEC